MDALFFLADAAHAHVNDGTFSVLRGGIDRAQSTSPGPIPLRAAAVARISGRPEDAGQHELRFRVVSRENVEVLHSPPQPLTFPENGGHHLIAANIMVVFPGPGHYVFELRLDGQVLATWPMQVVRAPGGGGV